MGIASLHAFVQSNWTGPALESYQYLACSNCVVPWLQSWYEGSIMNKKQLQDEVTACLVLDGEICCPVMSHPELLLLARVCLQVCCDRPQPLLVSISFVPFVQIKERKLLLLTDFLSVQRRTKIKDVFYSYGIQHCIQHCFGMDN
jgi:hypothetical protein